MPNPKIYYNTPVKAESTMSYMLIAHGRFNPVNNSSLISKVEQLAGMGYTLRICTSCPAEDVAYSAVPDQLKATHRERYIPYEGYNGYSSDDANVFVPTPQLIADMAKDIPHDVTGKLLQGHHAVCMAMLGASLDNHVDFICLLPGSKLTRFAKELAISYGIKTFTLNS